MEFLLLTLFAAAIAAVDQLVKYLVVANIPLYSHVPFLPGILDFTYIQNTGAAFSSFEGMQWLFALIFALFSVIILYTWFRRPMGFTKAEHWMIAAIYGGGLGNMIDRIRLGYVVDMIETQFMDFPVFNVADCFITCGCAALMISLAFFNKSFWQEDKK